MFWKDGFYEKSIDGAVEIDDTNYRSLLNEMESGKIIVTDKNGNPQAVDISLILTLEETKSKKIQELTSACSFAIISGYTSNALGSVYRYPSKTTDQINMMIATSDSLLSSNVSDWKTPFWCEDNNGLWEYRDHTASQIQKAAADGKSHIIACQTTLVQLKEKVSSLSKLDAINSISWPES